MINEIGYVAENFNEPSAGIKVFGGNAPSARRELRHDSLLQSHANGPRVIFAKLPSISTDTTAEVLYHGKVNYAPIPFVGVPRAERHVPRVFHASAEDAERMAVGYRIYNRWLADAVSTTPPRARGDDHAQPSVRFRKPRSAPVRAFGRRGSRHCRWVSEVRLWALCSDRCVTMDAMSNLQPATRHPSEELTDTWYAVIHGTIDLVYRDGFQRASANAIAKRVGVTWGVIQYYFGSREALLVSVIDFVIADALQRLEEMQIKGSNSVDRLQSFADSYFLIFGSRDLLAVNEIAWGLARDPSTRKATHAALAEWVERRDLVMAALLEDVSPKFKEDSELAALAIFALYGLAYAHETSSQLYQRVGVQSRKPDIANQRKLLVRALASLLEP